MSISRSSSSRSVRTPERCWRLRNNPSRASQQLDCVDKLRGVELHHFAAFYKSSWRAYDWMWGRLDGAGWLVHILLDPRRILAVVENAPDMTPHGDRAKQFANRLRAELGLPAGLPADCLEVDLAFLDVAVGAAAGQPAQLGPLPRPGLAAASLLRMSCRSSPNASSPTADGCQPLTDPRFTHPTKAVASSHDGRSGARRLVSSCAKAKAGPTAIRTAESLGHQNHEARVRTAPSPVDAYAQELPDCPVRWETLAGQMHTAAFARTATKATAVSTAALSTAPETPTTLRSTLAGARSITRTGYLATQATGGNGWKTLLAGGRPGRGRHRSGHQSVIVVGVTGTIAALARPLPDRAGRLGDPSGPARVPLIAITAFAAIGSLALAWVRREIWGSNATNGLVPEHVLPWLRNSWWGGLAAPRRSARDRRAHQPGYPAATHQPAGQ